MTDIKIQIDELEAAANERELIANLSTSEDAKTKNMQLALSLREKAAMLRLGQLPVVEDAA